MWYDGTYQRETNPYLTAKLGAKEREFGVCLLMSRYDRSDIVEVLD
jgi:hypothetical protein